MRYPIEKQVIDFQSLDPAELLSCANAGDASALFLVTCLSEGGYNIATINDVTSLERAAEGAKTGHFLNRAKYGLMLYFYYGQGEKLKKAKELIAGAAAELIEAAEQQDHPYAQTLLGIIYCEGIGRIAANAKISAALFRKGAEHGDALAQQMLAQYYQIGAGVEKDHAAALHWSGKAIAQGLAIAEKSMGDYYEAGAGFPKDMAKAAEWWLKAAQQGHAAAQFSYASWCMERGGDRKQDLAESLFWFKQAEKGGTSYARAMVAQRYEEGIGVAKNRLKAYSRYAALLTANNDSRLSSRVDPRTRAMIDFRLKKLILSSEKTVLDGVKYMSWKECRAWTVQPNFKAMPGRTLRRRHRKPKPHTP